MKYVVIGLIVFIVLVVLIVRSAIDDERQAAEYAGDSNDHNT